MRTSLTITAKLAVKRSKTLVPDKNLLDHPIIPKPLSFENFETVVAAATGWEFKDVVVTAIGPSVNRRMRGEAVFALIHFSGSRGNELAERCVQASVFKSRRKLKVCFECRGRIGHNARHVNVNCGRDSLSLAAGLALLVFIPE